MKNEEKKLGKICIWCIAAMVSIIPLLVIIMILILGDS